MSAIETSTLTKRFGDLVAVDGLDLTVERGEVFGFLGPNGAGKSTTINVLLGFLDPTSGSASVLGHDIEAESLALRERIGVLPEGFEPYDRLTAKEHVGYAAGLKGVDADVEGLLSRVGLQKEAWDRRAGEFSTGMAQRLALATALVGDPVLLILDEPSSGLDPSGMAEIRSLIREEAESGTTVFFSSHILSEVEAVCDRVGVLVDGDLAATGSLDDLRDTTADGVALSLSVEDVSDDLESTVAGVEGVREVDMTDGVLDVDLDGGRYKIDVIRRVEEGATITDVVAEEASLEAMFHRLVATRGSGDERAAGDASAPEVTQ